MKKEKGKKNINLKKILYGIRIFCMIVFLCLLLLLLPNILESSWQGIIFLIFCFILVIVSLWAILLRAHGDKEKISYNLLYIGFIGYLVLICCRLFFDSKVKLTMIYELDMNYFKTNYLILSFICLGIILYTLLFIWEEKRKV